MEMRGGFDDIATQLFSDENVKKALLEAILKKDLGKKLMEMKKK